MKYLYQIATESIISVIYNEAEVINTMWLENVEHPLLSGWINADTEEFLSTSLNYFKDDDSFFKIKHNVYCKRSSIEINYFDINMSSNNLIFKYDSDEDSLEEYNRITNIIQDGINKFIHITQE